MSSSLVGILTVDEGVVIFTPSRRMREADINIIPTQENRRVKSFVIQFLTQKIEKTILRAKFFSIQHECQAWIEIGIIAAHFLHEGHAKFGALRKNSTIQIKSYPSSLRGTI